MNAVNTGAPQPPGADGAGLTQRQAAERLGKSVGWINRLVKSGEIGLLPNGRIDPVTLSASLAQPVSTGAVRRNGGTLAEAKTEREQYAARTAALDYHTRVKTLTLVADVDAHTFEEARRQRDAILAVPAGVAPSLLGMTDVRLIEARIREAIKKALAPPPYGPDDARIASGSAH